MKQEKNDIISKWLIKGFEGYCFGSDKELYRLPFKSGLKYYGLRKIKKQVHNRWLINRKFWSERKLQPKIYLNPKPEVLIKVNETPF